LSDALFLMRPGTAGDEKQCQAGGFCLNCKPSEEGHRIGILEPVDEGFGEQHAEDAGFAASEGTGCRMWAAVSEAVGYLEDALAQII
jgi:hypothetical protein